MPGAGVHVGSQRTSDLSPGQVRDQVLRLRKALFVLHHLLDLEIENRIAFRDAVLAERTLVRTKLQDLEDRVTALET